MGDPKQPEGVTQSDPPTACDLDGTVRDAESVHEQLREYAAAGWQQVPIPPDEETGQPVKGPRGKGWNTPDRLISDPDDPRLRMIAENDATNVGVCHGPSGTAAIDIDDLEQAVRVSEALGIDLRALLDAEDAVRTESGRPDRAKLWYRAPEGVDLTTHKLTWTEPGAGADGTDKAHVIFELRAGAVQDVIPPSTHPGTRRAYEWRGNWREMPELPQPLLELWENWTALERLMKSLNPWQPEAAPTPKPPPAEHTEAPSVDGQICGPDLIALFNAQNSLEGIFLAKGYQQQGQRFLRPGSDTGTPGVRIFSDGETPVCYSHGGDVLNDGHVHDAFDVLRLLEHAGDWAAAFKAAEETCKASTGETVAEHNRRLWREAKGGEEAVIAELAGLSPLAYDQRREEAARELGCRVSTLDAEVDKRKLEAAEADVDQSASLFAEDPEPWGEPVDLASVLESFSVLLHRFVALPAGAATAIVLWVVHAYAHAAFWISALLALSSPEKRCGKTTLLSLIGHIAPRALSVSNITAASLFRVVEKYHPTLLVDEADSFLKDNEELRGILNSGHNRATARVIRTTGDDYEPSVFRTWSPKVIALIGDLPATLEDRSIKVPMRRRRPDEQVERLRGDRDPGFRDLGRQMRRWADDNMDALRIADPDVPANLHDRAADNWRPLLAIADRAGGRWPQAARDAAVLLTAAEDEGSARVLLLRDIEEIFSSRAADHISSTDLCEALTGLEDRPWCEWRKGNALTKTGLAKLLKPFGIRPRNKRLGDTVSKGYELSDFQDAFSRYLPISGDQTATPLQANEIKDLQPNQTATEGSGVAVANAEKPNENAGCSGVAVGSAPDGGGEEHHPHKSGQNELPLRPAQASHCEQEEGLL